MKNKLGITKYTREDISQLTDDEIPDEFLVKTADRRKNDRRCTNEYPCINVIVTENKLNQLVNDFYSFKKDIDKDAEKVDKERQQILHELDEIKNILARQKGFIAGIVWLGTGLIGVLSAALGFFKDSH